MDYMLKLIDAFTRFLDDGRICLSNNAAERALRGIALGRKAWLFAGSDRGRAASRCDVHAHANRQAQRRRSAGLARSRVVQSMSSRTNGATSLRRAASRSSGINPLIDRSATKMASIWRLLIMALPFRTSTKGVAFHKMQAEHPEASRTKQPLRCPAPRNQRQASRNGRGGNDEKT
jgi:hypothetical protein